MKKIMLAVVATCAVFAFVPASALAQRHHRHHAHHARVHHKKFGTDPSSPTTTPSSQSAGTVQSFTGGVLTIALTSGTTVSGMVTPDTEIICVTPETSGVMGHDEGDGGGGSFGDQGGNDQGDNDQGDNDQDDQNQASQTCDMTSLTAGAVVQEAELNISGAGAVWRKVVLATTSTSTSSSTSSSTWRH